MQQMQVQGAWGELTAAPGRAMRVVPLPPLPKGGPPAAAIWALIFIVLAGGIAATAIVSSRPKPKPLNISSAAFVAAQNPSTVNQLQTTYLGGPDTWTVRVRNSRLEYVWTSGALIRIVWDSVNAQCGPNLANYIALQTFLITNGGTVYSNQPGYSRTLGTTSPFINQAGVLTQFRLQLYAGDLRIEALNGSGKYWSIFAAPGNQNPDNWPSAAPEGSSLIVWKGVPVDGSPVSAFFTQDGQLAVRSPLTGAPWATYLWNASKSQPEGVIC